MAAMVPASPWRAPAAAAMPGGVAMALRHIGDEADGRDAALPQLRQIDTARPILERARPLGPRNIDMRIDGQKASMRDHITHIAAWLSARRPASSAFRITLGKARLRRGQ